ncbi:MAG TPA: DUF222 domain-containing protein [Acidimicrobiales bacterium]|nr:DUF222 domain-containing protein [Acidimicrobiales bacterium]
MSLVAELAEAVAEHDRFTARLTMAVGAFDASREWDAPGYVSAAEWLREQGYTRADAAWMVSAAKKLRCWPLVAAAWLDGRLSGGQIKIICAQAIDRHVGLFAEHEADLLAHLTSLDTLGTLTAMRVWRQRADALNPGPKPDDRENIAHMSATLEDRGHLTATLDAEGYGLAVAALEVADSHDFDIPAAERRGAALVAIFRWFCDHQNITNPANRHRPHLNVMIDAASLGTDHLEGFDITTGLRFDTETLQRLLCDCDLHRLMAAGSEILDYGRAVRTPPPGLWNALVARDQHCRHPGCDRPPSWCDAHHVEWWERDHGPTSIGNLVLKCSLHHPVAHRVGWSERLHPDGTYELTDPNGRTRVTRPPGTAAPPQDATAERENEFVRHLQAVRARAIGALLDAA